MTWIYKILDYLFDKLGEFIDRVIMRQRVQKAQDAAQQEMDNQKALQDALRQRQNALETIDRAAQEKTDAIKNKSDSEVLRED